MSRTWEGKPFWSLHTHSRFSVNDALPHVEAIVAEAHQLGYPALGLTDHGNITGAVAHYNACRKYGIEPLPGIEIYMTDDSELGRRAYEHLTIAAYTETGYRNLCRLSTLAYRNFHFRPRLDMADLAELSDAGKLDGLVASTGCYFGVTVQRLVKRGYQPAKRVVDFLAQQFPRVYVELQNHGVDHEDDGEFPNDDAIVDALYGMATEMGLPVLIAQDSHYIRRGDQELHDVLKQLVSWSDDPDDATFPGDGYYMTTADVLTDYFPPKILEAGLDGLDDLYRAAKVRIPELETFTSRVPDVTITGNAQAELEERVGKALEERYPGSKPHADRTADELSIIADSGAAGLLMVVAMLTDFMQEEGIWFSARGSASGSLTCQLLRITQLDPVARNLDMTRFLSRDRTKLPDIDLDIEHLRRPEIERFLSKHFSITQIGTLMTYSLWGEDEGDDMVGGSLRARYYSVRNKRGQPKIRWTEVPEDEVRAMTRLATMELISGYGTHPCGFVVAPDEATLAQLPTAFIPSSKTTVSAYGKKDVEKLGYLKVDALGLRDLTALRIACHSAGIPCGPSGPLPGAMPEDDKDVYKRICEGKTEGVFQLQGFSASKGVRRLLPKNKSDLAAAMALFRPASQDSGMTADFLARRKGKQKIPTRHVDIMEVTKDTYGVLLYQDQLVEVLRRLGMTPDELTEMLDAVKASNKYSAGAKTTIEGMLPRIRAYSETRRWGEEDISWLADALLAFSDYSFNKAHSEQYADNAYYSTYLAVHHQQDFWLGLLVAYADSTDKKKIPLLTRAARSYGVRIRPAHVNLSQPAACIDPTGSGIRKGLRAIKGIGAVMAAEIVKARGDQQFASVVDFGQRVNTSKVTGAKSLAIGTEPLACGGGVAALYDAGALDGLKGA